MIRKQIAIFGSNPQKGLNWTFNAILYDDTVQAFEVKDTVYSRLATGHALEKFHTDLAPYISYSNNFYHSFKQTCPNHRTYVHIPPPPCGTRGGGWVEIVQQDLRLPKILQQMNSTKRIILKHPLGLDITNCLSSEHNQQVRQKERERGSKLLTARAGLFVANTEDNINIELSVQQAGWRIKGSKIKVPQN